MLTPRLPLQDCQGPVHARFSKRRERRPGLRERHSASHQSKAETESQLSDTPRSMPRSTFAGHPHPGGISERCTVRTDPKRTPLGPREVNQNETQDEVMVSTHYKELSTIDAIRKQLASEPRPHTAPPTLPDWLLNLDLNLDITAVDIIPPFDSSTQKSDDTYRSKPKVTIIHEENCDSDSADSERLTDNEGFYYDAQEEGEYQERRPDWEGRRTASRLSNTYAFDSVSKGNASFTYQLETKTKHLGKQTCCLLIKKKCYRNKN